MLSGIINLPPRTVARPWGAAHKVMFIPMLSAGPFLPGWEKSIALLGRDIGVPPRGNSMIFSEGPFWVVPFCDLSAVFCLSPFA